MESSPTITALARASRRAVYHLLQAGIEGLKAIEAVIEEIGAIGNEDGHHDRDSSRQKIEIE
ncbi:MAG: hypothetical protein V3S26_06525 [Acidimicrobiia bacterium]|jgi:hypothetical protein